MYEKFTDRARKVMTLANQEAHRFNRKYIGTEDVLLALINEGGGVAANVLKNLGVDLCKLRLDIEKLKGSSVASSVLKNLDVDLRKILLEVEKIARSHPGMRNIGKLPQTPRAKKVIAYAIDESRNMQHDYVGSEHILLGLLREQGGVAAQVLMNEGLTLDETRNEVMELLKCGIRGKLMPVAKSRLARSKIEDLPDELKETVGSLDAEFERAMAAKEKAVAAQQFDEAAAHRDRGYKLLRERQQAIHDWAVNYPIETAWLRHNNSAVIDLAHEINQLRSWEALPELADALEQAGCNDARLLEHCRQGGAHTEQCWVVDLLLASAEPPDVSRP